MCLFLCQASPQIFNILGVSTPAQHTSPSHCDGTVPLPEGKCREVAPPLWEIPHYSWGQLSLDSIAPERGDEQGPLPPSLALWTLTTQTVVWRPAASASPKNML